MPNKIKKIAIEINALQRIVDLDIPLMSDVNIDIGIRLQNGMRLLLEKFGRLHVKIALGGAGEELNPAIEECKDILHTLREHLISFLFRVIDVRMTYFPDKYLSDVKAMTRQLGNQLDNIMLIPSESIVELELYWAVFNSSYVKTLRQMQEDIDVSVRRHAKAQELELRLQSTTTAQMLGELRHACDEERSIGREEAAIEQSLDELAKPENEFLLYQAYRAINKNREPLIPNRFALKIVEERENLSDEVCRKLALLNLYIQDSIASNRPEKWSLATNVMCSLPSHIRLNLHRYSDIVDSNILTVAIATNAEFRRARASGTVAAPEELGMPPRMERR